MFQKIICISGERLFPGSPAVEPPTPPLAVRVTALCWREAVGLLVTLGAGATGLGWVICPGLSLGQDIPPGILGWCSQVGVRPEVLSKHL